MARNRNTNQNKKKSKKNVRNRSAASNFSSDAEIAAVSANDAAASDAISDGASATGSMWSSATECSYYASLGCHIASIARLGDNVTGDPVVINSKSKPRRKSSSNDNPRAARATSRNNTCSYYQEMYQKALQQYPWLLGIERFDPSEYHHEDLELIPDIAFNDGNDDDEEYEDCDGVINGDCDTKEIDQGRKQMTLTLTNVTQQTNICFLTVYDVDLCGADGTILTSGWSFVTTASPIGTETNTSSGAKVTNDNGQKTPITISPSTTRITKKRKCTTFIVLCPPQTFVHLCSLAPNQFQSFNDEEKNERKQTLSNDAIPVTSWSQIEIESDVQPWSFHPNVEDEHSYLLHFPFHGLGYDSLRIESRHVSNEEHVDLSIQPKKSIDEIQTSSPLSPKTNTANALSAASISGKQSSVTAPEAYQCIQSENGQLTHFFHGNYHAIDFACPIGTPLYSPANGVVVEVCDNGGGCGPESFADRSEDGNIVESNGRSDSLNHSKVIEVSGIAARNLFHWNSIMIRVDEEVKNSAIDEAAHTTTLSKAISEMSSNPLYIEYVHIQTNSSVVQVGDTVVKGQLLCRSGSVGFSPKPHLHLAAYRSYDKKAATVRVKFECVLPIGGNNAAADSCGGVVVDGYASIDGKKEKIQENKSNESASSFLPMAGGWYNKTGLLINFRH